MSGDGTAAVAVGPLKAQLTTGTGVTAEALAGGAKAQADASFADTPLVNPYLFVIGASVEAFAETGDAANSRFGHSGSGMLHWANELGVARLWNADIQASATGRGWAAPYNFASPGATWDGAGERTSITAQIATVAALLPTIPRGKRAVHYTGGRNDLSAMDTGPYMVRFLVGLATLAALADLIIVPGLWLRGTSTSGWTSGSAARRRMLEVNAAMEQACATYGKQVIFVPLLDVMCEATGDRIPKTGYVFDEIHPTVLGCQRGGEAYRAAILASGRITPQGIPIATMVPNNLMPTGTGNGGELGTGVTGSVAAGYRLNSGSTAITVVGDRSEYNVQRVNHTRSTSQTSTWVASEYTVPAGSYPSVGIGKKYRSWFRLRIDPTPIPVAIEAFLTEFIGSTAIQSVQARYNIEGSAEPAKGVRFPNNSISPCDASAGLTLWLETPPLVVKSTTGDPKVGFFCRVGIPAGDPATISWRIDSQALVETA